MMHPTEVLWTAGLGFVIVGTFGYVFSVYNGLVELRQRLGRAWAHLDAVLRERREAVPALLALWPTPTEQAQGVHASLRAAVTAVEEARSWTDRAQAERMLGEAIAHTFVAAAVEPEHADEADFRAVQQRFGELEQRLQDRRRYHDDLVVLFNGRIVRSPDRVFARLMRLTAAEPFRGAVVEREHPVLELQHSA
jgi:LemA protein